ncbi:MAG: 50S ribosomal protein L29 [Bacteroidota bacterium]
MKYSEINALSPEERQEKLTAELENLRQLRFAHAITPIENPVRIRQSRKHIARLKTAQNALKSQN